MTEAQQAEPEKDDELDEDADDTPGMSWRFLPAMICGRKDGTLLRRALYVGGKWIISDVSAGPGVCADAAAGLKTGPVAIAPMISGVKVVAGPADLVELCGMIAIDEPGVHWALTTIAAAIVALDEERDLSFEVLAVNGVAVIVTATVFARGADPFADRVLHTEVRSVPDLASAFLLCETWTPGGDQ